MTIRRVDKRDKIAVQPSTAAKSRAVDLGNGEDFARQLAELSSIRESVGINPVQSVSDHTSGGKDPTPYQRRAQLEQTDELLDSLEALGRDLGENDLTESPEIVRERLLKTRDQALRTLSDVPERGKERELLHRTAVLATVELAKTDRGDYK